MEVIPIYELKRRERENLPMRYEVKRKERENPFLCCLFVNSETFNTETDYVTCAQHHHPMVMEEATLYLYPC